MKQTQNSVPEWYWVRGLHDARIIATAKKESNWNPEDHCLILKMDCKGAMFESDITEIRFYNYRIVTTDFDASWLNGGWWLSDEMVKKGEYYRLDIKFDTAKCKTKHLEIIFKRAEVMRE